MRTERNTSEKTVCSRIHRWQEAAYKPFLHRNEVHVWCVNTKMFPDTSFIDILNEKEKNKARLFYFQRDKNSFIVRHGLLRVLIGKYLRLSPNLIQFKCGKYGKPSIVQDSNKGILQFNMSYSREQILFAFTLNRSVGADIEFMKVSSDMDSVARLSFSPQEYEAFEKTIQSLKTHCFYRIWTRKEALLKAMGKGLGGGSLDEIDVTLEHYVEMPVERIGMQVQKNPSWRLKSLAPAPEYMAAIAAEGSGWNVTLKTIDSCDLMKDILTLP